MQYCIVAFSGGASLGAVVYDLSDAFRGRPADSCRKCLGALSVTFLSMCMSLGLAWMTRSGNMLGAFLALHFPTSVSTAFIWVRAVIAGNFVSPILGPLR